MKTLPLVSVLALSLLTAGCASNKAESPPLTDTERVEAFCGLIADSRALETDLDLNGLAMQMQVAATNATTDEDPDAVAAIRTFGTAMESFGTEAAPIYTDLLEVTDDPMLERAIELLIETLQSYYVPIGRGLSGVNRQSDMADLLAQYQSDFETMASDPQNLDAVEFLEDYSLSNCGFSSSTLE